MLDLKNLRVLLLDYAGIIVGVIITALALAVFLIPNQIAAGGVSGAAIVLHHVFGFGVGTLILIMNIPIFGISIKFLGAGFVFRTLIGVVVLSLSVDFLQPVVPVLTREPLLAAIYGGALAGLGMGLVLKSGGTTGGTDAIARLMNLFTGISIGQSLFIVDFVVIGTAGIVFGAELALYALIALFTTGKVIDAVQQGFSLARAALVISSKPQKITEKILKDLERGVTLLYGKGAYSQQENEVLLVVVSRSEISPLKRLVKEIDSEAFVIIAQVHEVLGEGFKKNDV